MNQKVFLLNEKVEYSSKEITDKIQQEKTDFSANQWDKRERLADEAMQEECTLKCVHGRIIIRVNIESKNSHKFSNGMIIRRERNFNNFNFREVNPSNGVVISAENIPRGAEVLFDYTSLHDSNKIFSYKSGSPDVHYFSFKEDEVYAWRVNGEWKPTPNCEFALRVFRPYTGTLIGIQPTLLKDVLYITTGSLKGNVARTLKGCDYQIVFQDNGKESNIIRFRHSDNPDFDKEELICIADDLTEELNNGNLLVGLNANDCKKINEL